MSGGVFVLLSALALASWPSEARGSMAVLGIDLGGEWFKMAVVSAGAYDIVLNEQSGRRTPNLLAFYQNERFFGNEAKPLVRQTGREARSERTRR
jgi:molecular chaperone DnaK (HSP70)